MTLLEFGINLGSKNLLLLSYNHSKSAPLLDPDVRAGFISTLGEFSKDLFGGELNKVVMEDLEMLIFSKMLKSFTSPREKKPLICYSIIDSTKDVRSVQPILKKALNYFLNRFAIYDIFTKDRKYFENYVPRILDLLKDNKINIDNLVNNNFWKD